MQLHIELTKTMNFAGWEGGSFNTKYNSGRSVLLAKPNAEKIDVLYDTSAMKSPNHYLFILDVDYIVAQVQVRLYRSRHTEDSYKMRLVLSRITKLYTENIQGHANCTANTDLIWACQADYSSKEKMMALSEYSEDLLGYRVEYKLFMQAALEKAITNRESQRLFWGTPRKTTEHV